MSAEDVRHKWSQDPDLNEITSPLAGNFKLHVMITAIRAMKPGDEEDHRAEGYQAREDAYFERVERLADYLVHRSDAGGLALWDWEAQFVCSEEFRELYDSDRHWVFDDLIVDDVTQVLADPDWSMNHAARLSRYELRNLLEVMAHFPDRLPEDALLEVERILDSDP